MFWSRGPGRYPICLDVKFPMECTENHVWGTHVPWDTFTFVKHVFFGGGRVGDNHSWNEQWKLYRTVFSTYNNVDVRSKLWGYYNNMILWHHDSLPIIVSCFAILYCILLYHTILCYIMLYYSILYYIVVCCIMLHYHVLYCTTLK